MRDLAQTAPLPSRAIPKDPIIPGVAESQIGERYGGGNQARLADENCDIATAEELALFTVAEEVR